MAAMRDVQQVDHVVLNAGILKYPNVSKKKFLPIGLDENPARV